MDQTWERACYQFAAEHDGEFKGVRLHGFTIPHVRARQVEIDNFDDRAIGYAIDLRHQDNSSELLLFLADGRLLHRDVGNAKTPPSAG